VEVVEVEEQIMPLIQDLVVVVEELVGLVLTPQ